MVRWKLSSYTTVMVSLRNIDSVLVTDSLFSFKNVKKRPNPPYTPFKGNSEEKIFFFFARGSGSLVSLLVFRAFELHYEQIS